MRRSVRMMGTASCDATIALAWALTAKRCLFLASCASSTCAQQLYNGNNNGNNNSERQKTKKSKHRCQALNLGKGTPHSHPLPFNLFDTGRLYVAAYAEIHWKHGSNAVCATKQAGARENTAHCTPHLAEAARAQHADKRHVIQRRRGVQEEELLERGGPPP